MNRSALTTGIWLVSLTSLVLAGVVAGGFVVMAASLDPTDLLTEGTGPWVNALIAGLMFTGQIVVTTISLRAWHSTRFKIVGVILAVVDAGVVGWVCLMFYQEYL